MIKKLDRIDKILLIQDQINNIKAQKNKLAVKIPCNNDKGYDFCQLKNLEFNIPQFPVKKLKNKKGETLTEALKKVDESYKNIIKEFEKELINQIELLYNK